MRQNCKNLTMSRHMANLYKRNFRKRQLEDRVARGDSEKMPLTSAEQNRLYRKRKKHKREDAARPSTSADISDSDRPVDIDIDASSEELSVCELWEARWNTSNTRFKNMFTNEFGLECSVYTLGRTWYTSRCTSVDMFASGSYANGWTISSSQCCISFTTLK
jgi:hypothetical protein